MDLETLTKETILKNMTPEQQQAVLESVMASVQESKKVRSQKVAENVDLVMQALKKIEAQMLAKVSKATDLAETAAKNVKDGKDGRDGKDGKAGKDGAVGPKGVDGRPGKDGKDGKDGRDGVDGVSVVDARIDFDGSLTIVLSNGKEINAGEVMSSEEAKLIHQVTSHPAGTGSTSQEVLDALAAIQATIATYGTMALQNANNVAITGGTISGATLSNDTVTGGLGSPDYIAFNTSYATTLAAGQLGWDGNNTLGLGMTGGNVIQHIGEDQFIYVKASSAITKGQLIMFNGTDGASGHILAIPATGLTVAQYIIGIAAESLSIGGFGLVQTFGQLDGIDTSGSSVGETWANGDVLYYNSSYAGGLTKTFPTSGPIVIVAAIIYAHSGTTGKIIVRPSFTQKISAGTGISVSQTASG